MEETIQSTELTVSSELNEVVSISKVEHTLAQKHALAFAPSMRRVHELSEALTTIDKENPTAEQSATARRNRLDMVKNRTAAAAIKDERKATLIVEGKLIDNLYGVVKHTSELTEAEYEKIEKFAEIREKEHKDKIRTERLELLKAYTDQGAIYPLADMTQEAFDQLLAGLKMLDEQKKETAKKAEEARIENERKEKLRAEQEKIRQENERLKKEKEEADAKAAADAKIKETRNMELRPYIVFIRDYNKMLALPEAEYKKELSDVKEAAKLQWEFDAKEERRKAKEQADKDALLAAEKKEKEKAQAALKAKQDAEAKLKADAEKKDKERIAAEKKAAKAPDKEKLNALAVTIGTIVYPVMKSDEGKKILENVEVLLDKVVAYIKEKSSEL